MVNFRSERSKWMWMSNALKESVDAQRHDNFLKLGKRRDRNKKRVAESNEAARK